MFSKILEDSSCSFVVQGEVVLSVDSHIVHVDFEPSFHYHVHTNMIHECLEGGGCIAKTEKHDSWFIQSQGGYESSLPLVFLP